MEMSYLYSIEKQHTKHRSAMQQGVNAIAAHMSNHNSIYSKGTIVGIITDMCHCVKEAITEGNAVMLGIREILEVSSVTLRDAERVYFVVRK